METKVQSERINSNIQSLKIQLETHKTDLTNLTNKIDERSGQLYNLIIYYIYVHIYVAKGVLHVVYMSG